MDGIANAGWSTCHEFCSDPNYRLFVLLGRRGFVVVGGPDVPVLEGPGGGGFLRVDRCDRSRLDAERWKLCKIRAPTDGAKACMRHRRVAVQVCICASWCWPCMDALRSASHVFAASKRAGGGGFGHISIPHPPTAPSSFATTPQCPKNPAYKSANPCLPRLSLVEDKDGCW